MKLLTLNVDNHFTSLANKMTDGKGDEVLFVNWKPASKKKSRDLDQEKIIKSTPKDVRMVVFDRYRALTEGDVTYLLKRNAILLEPTLNPRPGFLFMPYWITRTDLPLDSWSNNRTFHTGYKGEGLSTEAEAILAKAVKNYNSLSVGISVDEKIQSSRYSVIRELMYVGDYKWNDFNTTILTGSEFDYHYGVLPDITNHLKYGVIPLLDHKHKWFHALFKEFILFDTYPISWYNKNFGSIYYGFIEQLYKNIEDYMPEMLIENFVNTIISLN